MKDKTRFRFDCRMQSEYLIRSLSTYSKFWNTGAFFYMFDAEIIFFIYYVKLCENKSGTEVNSTCDLAISASVAKMNSSNSLNNGGNAHCV